MRIADAATYKGLSSLDCELIAAHVLRRPRSWIIAHPDAQLPEKKMLRLLARRARGEPLAYIVGYKDFFGRPFCVSPCVLIPRPATEALVEFAADVLRSRKRVCAVRGLDAGIRGFAAVWSSSRGCTIVDIGTGSGCIAITLAKMFVRRRVIATDVSAAALRVAKSNAALHDASIVLRGGHDLQPLRHVRVPFLVVTNPPYVPQGANVDRSVAKFEPHRAVFGPRTLFRIVRKASMHPTCVGIVLECRSDQVDNIMRILRASLPAERRAFLDMRRSTVPASRPT
jgi:release factor glutamine methyltransferase